MYYIHIYIHWSVAAALMAQLLPSKTITQTTTRLTKTTNEIKNCQKDFYWLLMLLLTDRHYTNRLWVITTVQTLCNNAPTHRLTIVALHLGGLWLSFAIAPPLLDHRLAGDAASVLLIALQQVQLCWCACAFVVRVTMCRCVGFIALMSQHRT